MRWYQIPNPPNVPRQDGSIGDSTRHAPARIPQPHFLGEGTRNPRRCGEQPHHQRRTRWLCDHVPVHEPRGEVLGGWCRDARCGGVEEAQSQGNDRERGRGEILFRLGATRAKIDRSTARGR